MASDKVKKLAEEVVRQFERHADNHSNSKPAAEKLIELIEAMMEESLTVIEFNPMGGTPDGR